MKFAIATEETVDSSIVFKNDNTKLFAIRSRPSDTKGKLAAHPLLNPSCFANAKKTVVEINATTSKSSIDFTPPLDVSSRRITLTITEPEQYSRKQKIPHASPASRASYCYVPLECDCVPKSIADGIVVNRGSFGSFAIGVKNRINSVSDGCIDFKTDLLRRSGSTICYPALGSVKRLCHSCNGMYLTRPILPRVYGTRSSTDAGGIPTCILEFQRSGY